MLFDGETSLRSQKIKNLIKQQHGLRIHAEPYFKRNIAERAVKEIKLRTVILLDLKGKKLSSTLLQTVRHNVNTMFRTSYDKMERSFGNSGEHNQLPSTTAIQIRKSNVGKIFYPTNSCQYTANIFPFISV